MEKETANALEMAEKKAQKREEKKKVKTCKKCLIINSKYILEDKDI